MIWGIKAYLERCIALALGIEEPEKRPWNVRTDQWPPFIDRRRKSPDWLALVTAEFDRRRREPVWDIEVPVYQEAIGAMAEWRTALQFLSRLVRDSRKTAQHPHGLLTLDAPDQEVIDACIREVMKDKQPTLGHRMLAALGGLLRLDILLTTNFDDLLERAFTGARNPLTVFEVPLSGTMPHWSAVSNQRSLVKLHGHRHSLRADYTLDALPTESDRYRFLEYLATADGRQKMFMARADNRPVKDLPVQNHLLIMGVAATERRTRSLIESAWTHLASDFRVIWLCHAPKDVEAVQALTRDFKRNHKENDPHWEGSRILRHEHLGLLFLQLYQSIRRGLPTTGMIFPSVSRLAVPPLPSLRDIRESNDTHKATRSRLEKDVAEQIVAMMTPGFPGKKLAVITSSPDVSGATTACAELYDSLQAKESICLWLDMNDIASTDDLFEQLLEAAYYRLGIETWMPVFIAKTPRPRAAEIQRLAQSTNKPWVIFLNARETPGANFGDDAQVLDECYPNNWVDHDLKYAQDQYDANSEGAREAASQCYEGVAQLLAELCGAQSPTIAVVLLCRAQCAAGLPCSDPPLIAHLRKVGMLRPSGDVHSAIEPMLRAYEPIVLETVGVAFNSDSVIVDVLNWVHEDESECKARRHFLHALVLMQRTRFLSSIWCQAVSPMALEIHNHFVDRISWVTALEELGLLRRKVGGFIWMHARARNQLRLLLSSKERRKKFFDERKAMKASQKPVELQGLGRRLEEWKPEQSAALIHSNLAEWFRRVFAAANSPAALFEAVYHSCRSTISSIATIGNTSQQCITQCDLASSQVEAAVSLLRANAWLVQTHGYSRGSCRRLEYVRFELCKEIDAHCDRYENGSKGSRQWFLKDVQPRVRSIKEGTRLLRIQCTEVMRAIAREVGEDIRAIERHNALPRLLAGNPDSRSLVSSDTIAEKDLFQACFARPEGASQRCVNALQWVRWCRWRGMLFIQKRDYQTSLTALRLAVLSSTFVNGPASALSYDIVPRLHDLNIDLLESIATVVKHCVNGTLRIFGRPTDMHRIRLECLRVVEQIVTQQLLDISLARRRDMANRPVKTALPNVLETVGQMISQGLGLAEHILLLNETFGSEIAPNAMWCKSRLLMHRSACIQHMARLNANRSCEQWDEGMQALADSESCLNVGDLRRLGSDRAVIELHRAELRLTEAELIEFQHSGSDIKSFGDICRETSCRNDLANDVGTILWMARGEKLRNDVFALHDCSADGTKTDKLVDESVKAAGTRVESLRKVKALVQDAMRFLRRAEDTLRNRRRNVWWTCWFFQRKLTAISMSVWASVPEIGTPIPYVGEESAPRNTPTAADDVLEDAIRMTRSDAYRLATIVEAYTSLCAALQVRLMMDAKALRIPERQRDMGNRLHDACSRLMETALGRYERTEMDLRQMADDPVVTYIITVFDKAAIATKYLSSPTE